MRRSLQFLTGVMLAAATATTPVQGADTASGAAPVAATRQETAVEGTVRASEQPQRLAGVSIILEGRGSASGTRQEVVSGDDGSFMFESVPAGEYQITAGILGRRMATRDVTVVAGETARADFALEIEALSLDELVITGTVLPTSVREVPTPITIVSRADNLRRNLQSGRKTVSERVPDRLSGVHQAEHEPLARAPRRHVRLHPRLQPDKPRAWTFGLRF